MKKGFLFSRYFPISIYAICIIFFLNSCNFSDLDSKQKLPPFPSNLKSPIESNDPKVYALNVFKNPELSFEHLGLQQGLSNSTITVGVQDQLGILWFGSFDGLNKFDGYQIEVFRHDLEDANSISDNIIYDILVDDEGILWIGTDNGLNRLDPRSGIFTHFTNDLTQDRSISNNVVNDLILDSTGRLWIATEAGLNLFDPETNTFTRYPFTRNGDSPILSNVIYALYEDPEGEIWVGTAAGLMVFDPVMESYLELPTNLEDDFLNKGISVNEIYPTRAGLIWLGTSDGLFVYSLATRDGVWYRPRDMDKSSLSEKNVLSIFEDQSGLIWIGTSQGLNLFQPEQEKFIQFKKNAFNPNSLSDNIINHIFQDESGMIWLSTANGINLLDLTTKQFLHFHNLPDQLDSLINNQVFAIKEDKKGYLWIGTVQGLDRLDRRTNHYRHFTFEPENKDGLSDDFITAILEDSKGTLWFGTDSGGVNRYDSIYETFEHYRFSPVTTNSISNDTVSVLMEDQEGFIWIGTANGMLDKLDPETDQYQHFQLDTGDPVSQLKIRIRSIIQDQKGQIWLGTSYGLYQLDPLTGNISRYQNDPNNDFSLSDDFILSLYEDESGIIWVGTYGGGINRFDPTAGIFWNFTQKDGLANDTVYGILEDEHKNLWLSTNHGISKFNPELESFENFDVKDGLQSNEFNERAYFKSTSGELFFGGVNGVTAFFPDHIRDNPYLSPVVLSSFTIGGQPVNGETSIEYIDSVELKWPQNYFEFSFSGLSYQQPEANQYAYFLRGFDKDWNLIGNLRFGRYTNLPGGDYELLLIAANENGVWNLEGKTIHIKISPPFWERPIFQWGLLLMIGLLAGAGYYIKVRSVQKRNKELSEMVEERTAEIEQKRQVAEGLKNVLGILNSNQSLQESLNFIVSSANRLTNADLVLLLGIKSDPVTCVSVKESQGRIQLKDLCTDEEIEKSPEFINWLGDLAKSGKVLRINDLNEFLNLQNQNRFIDRFPIRSMLMIPVLSGVDLFGSFVMIYHEEKKFSNEQVELASSFADQAALAIGNANLRESAEQMAVTAERNRLARDLHDAVTQTLFSASMIAEALPALLEKDPQEGKKMLKEMRQLSRGALAEMRTLLIELRPSAVIETKLPELIRQLSEAVSGKTGVKVDFSSHFSNILPEDVHISFYRIAQEALNNIVKHAHAKHVEIILESHTINEVFISVGMEIRDDGIGFNPDEIEINHFGLGIMNERAELIKAELTIESNKGNGTLINVEWQGRVG